MSKQINIQNKPSEDDKRKLVRLLKLIPAVKEDILNGSLLLVQAHEHLKHLSVKYEDKILNEKILKNLKNLFVSLNSLNELYTIKYDEEVFVLQNILKEEAIKLDPALKTRKNRYKVNNKYKK